MMKSTALYQVDAFTSTLFHGNPAAVCVFEDNSGWIISESKMLNIAKENNLAETAFVFKDTVASTSVRPRYNLRWFTPDIEMDLCGHATLASAHVVFNYYEKEAHTITFYSQFSGELVVERTQEELYRMTLPNRVPIESTLPSEISSGLSKQPSLVLKSRDYILVYQTEEDVENIQLDKETIDKINLDPGGIVITAPRTKEGGTPDYQFVSRYFTPQCDQFEDPVTGSAHCSLIPYWSKRLDKKKLIAKQISKRGGELICEYLDEDHVAVSGRAVTFFKGHMFI